MLKTQSPGAQRAEMVLDNYSDEDDRLFRLLWDLAAYVKEVHGPSYTLAHIAASAEHVYQVQSR